jgi:hypothetical protein
VETGRKAVQLCIDRSPMLASRHSDVQIRESRSRVRISWGLSTEARTSDGVVAKFLRPPGEPQLCEGLSLPPTDSFATDAEAASDLFERTLVPVEKTESELEHTPLTRLKCLQRCVELVF